MAKGRKTPKRKVEISTDEDSDSEFAPSISTLSSAPDSSSDFEDEPPLPPPPRHPENTENVENSDQDEEIVQTREQRPRVRNKDKEKERKLKFENQMTEWHEEWHVDWAELQVRNKERMARLVPIEQPSTLQNVRLLPFQLEGLSWLLDQEDTGFNGGILADSMGMGKTVQTIGLLVSRKALTLVICPVVALFQWRDEIQKYAGTGLSVLIYHGTAKVEKKEEIFEFDVILTTYAVVEAAFRKEKSGVVRKQRKVYEKSLLHSISWGRVVLDEAHSIKDRSCSTARSVFALTSEKKWSLSGTPLQNRVGELYSLISSTLALFSESKTKFAGYVRAGTVLNHYAHIFELLSKLRQSACHPALVVHKNATVENPGTYVCGICHDIAEDAISSKCKHVFCREDIRMYMESVMTESVKVDCPVCFTQLNINLEQETLQPPNFNDINKSEGRQYASIVNRMMQSIDTPFSWTSSTKIEALLEELDNLRILDRTIKSIVFSQFVSFLDLIYWRLQKAGYNCVKLDGRMTPIQRDSVIKSFMNLPQVTVFLVSLKAGGVALNLTEASRIFMMDPWWNPAVEDQAMDRIHRLGQKRAVKITKIIVDDSIESRIVQLQEKKHLLFQSTIGKDAAALDRLTEEDLGFLFQM